MIWINAEDVIFLHTQVIRQTGGLDGIRDRAGLEAALAAPLQSFGGQELFPSTVEKIARLGYGVASNHASSMATSGSVSACTAPVGMNGYSLALDRGELADMFIAIADGSAKESDLLRWIHAHLR